MGIATERRPAAALSALLAGLQGGMLGVCWMMVWLGVTATWQSRSFWTAGNLMASVFYGARSLRPGFSVRTLSGLALYLLLYSSLGAVFALAVRNRLSRIRTLLVSIVFAMGWYYLSFHLVWKTAMPLVALLHSERYTALGHMLYGSFLGRFPAYLTETAREPAKAPEPNTIETATDVEFTEPRP